MEEDLVIWDVFSQVVSLVPERPLVIEANGVSTYAEVHQRASRFAAYLTAQGLGHQRPRHELQGWESGQSHVALMLGNSAVYLEAMLACFRARAVPVNVNYRYVAEELRHLLSMSGTAAIVYDAAFEDVVAEATSSLDGLTTLVRVGSGPVGVHGSVDFEALVAEAGSSVPLEPPQPDDLCIVCTGGTTGFPKAVLWRQADLMAMMIGNRHLLTGAPVTAVGDLLEGVGEEEQRVVLGPPMMHLSGLGLALVISLSGATLVLPGPSTGMDANAILRAVEQHRAQQLVVVGDAFGRPLLEALRAHRYDTSSLRLVMNGGATMSPAVKLALSEALGGVRVADGVGSSESGVLARSSGTGELRAGVFRPSAAACIVSEDLSHVLEPGDPSIGWLAGWGRVPLGYLGDPERTAATFPTIDGERLTVPGDRARWLEDRTIELLGRDATTINTGGEKVYSDEVERVLLRHPAVEECLVVGRPSQRWGQEVVALVVVQDGTVLDEAELLDCARQDLARYKIPKEIVLVERIERTAVGKPDYRWARGRVAPVHGPSTTEVRGSAGETGAG